MAINTILHRTPILSKPPNKIFLALLAEACCALALDLGAKSELLNN
jgi:hypothetical protein